MDRIDRNYYLKQLIEKRDNGRVKVVTGIRRCGKSVADYAETGCGEKRQIPKPSRIG